VRPHILRFGATIALAALSLGANDEAAPKTDTGNDFVQGKRVILTTDFTRESLGGFPRIFELKSGNMEVADVGGKRFFRATSSGEFNILLPETLPQRFTMEFDLAGSGGWYQHIYFSGDEEPYFILLRPQDDGGIQGPNGFDVRSEHGHTVEEGKPVNVRIMADGQYVKVYMNGTRVANAPNAKIGRAKKIRFRMAADSDLPALLGNLRIAAGGKDLYRALNEEGSFTAEGILFDTNSDRIRPESASALKEIADVLLAHADLKVSIEGHTDDTGSDDTNQALSEKRAAAVKAWLSTQGKVPADRLESAGFGSRRPAASNETAEGKQTNRRVEIVRL
jgi:outer membrane protein OmpA-like peptidoglycan-associated protein